jgi:cysteinyl-tRNA synthetase
MDIKLHNTLTGTKDVFTPLKAGAVSMYNCGPTVYGVQHIGNLSMFVFTDILRRMFEYNGLAVDQVINITDFGHLSGDNHGDADTGEDRMSKGLRQEGLELTLPNMKIMAEKYAQIWKDDLGKLGIDTGRIRFPFASDYIQEQIEMIRTLETKEYAYTGTDGVYFDTSKFPNYGKLGNINLEGLRAGARVDQKDEKKNPTDFLLWKSDAKLGWQSPWGLGFPGWHIECSAMIFKLLGEQIDVHTGGIEHIAIHHNNEIAQAESASGKSPFSQFWLHRAHLQINGGKISKSDGTSVYLSEIIERGYDPLAFRYLLLTSHYRTPSNFTWEALDGAQIALKRLREFNIKTIENEDKGFGEKTHIEIQEEKFNTYINDDLDTPKVLALIWEITKNGQLSLAEKKKLILKFDRVLGLQLDHIEILEIPENVQELIDQRDVARVEKDFAKSDELRAQIEQLGFEVMDTPEGTKVEKK